jgi:hypothetical protein
MMKRIKKFIIKRQSLKEWKEMKKKKWLSEGMSLDKVNIKLDNYKLVWKDFWD